MADKRKKRSRRAALWTVGMLGGMGAFYLYQPQRIDFFPTPAPDPNPPVDPDSAELFKKGTRVAVISAHPDDTEFYIGGTLTKLHEAGAKILLIVCTDGDKGYYPWFMTNASENRRVRRIEQIDAAGKYGAEVCFLAKPDGRLHADPELVSEIETQLERFQPEYVLAFDPQYPPRLQHSDHLQSGVAAAEAILSVSSAKWLMRYSTHAANFFVDISGLWDTKMNLLAIHKSQFNSGRVGQVASIVRGRAEQDGKAAGVNLAEGFRVSRLSQP